MKHAGTIALLFIAILAGGEAVSVAQATSRPLQDKELPQNALLQLGEGAEVDAEEPLTALVIAGGILLLAKVVYSVYAIRAKHAAQIKALTSFTAKATRSMCDMRLAHYSSVHSLSILTSAATNMLESIVAARPARARCSRAPADADSMDDLLVTVHRAVSAVPATSPSSAAPASGEASEALQSLARAVDSLRARLESLEARSLGDFEAETTYTGGSTCSPRLDAEGMRADAAKIREHTALLQAEARAGVDGCMKDETLGLAFTEMFHRLQKSLGTEEETGALGDLFKSAEETRKVAKAAVDSVRPGSGAAQGRAATLVNEGAFAVISTLAVAGMIDLKSEAPGGDVTVGGIDMGFSLQHLVGAGIALVMSVPVKAYEMHLENLAATATAEARTAVCDDMALLLASTASQAHAMTSAVRLAESIMPHSLVDDVPAMDADMPAETHTAITSAHLFASTAPIERLDALLRPGASVIVNLLASPTLPQRFRTRVLHSRKMRHVVDAILHEAKIRADLNMDTMLRAVEAAHCSQLGIVEQRRWETFHAKRTTERLVAEQRQAAAAPAPVAQDAAALQPAVGQAPQDAAVPVPVPAPAPAPPAAARVSSIVPAELDGPLCSVTSMTVVALAVAALSHSSEAESFFRSANPKFDDACASLQNAYSVYFSADSGSVAKKLAETDLKDPCDTASAILKHTVKSAYITTHELTGTVTAKVWAKPMETAVLQAIRGGINDGKAGPIEALLHVVTTAAQGLTLPTADDTEVTVKNQGVLGQAIFATLQLLHPATTTAAEGVAVPENEDPKKWVAAPLATLPVRGGRSEACVGASAYTGFLNSWMQSLTGPHAWFFATLSSVLRKDVVTTFTARSLSTSAPAPTE